ncbi:MAG: chemotaxis protein CheW, partial [Deltaproteobacteria bacterium]|nr:chemotaxis protein CheW [Deltaproteobacteria bacterium]
PGLSLARGVTEVSGRGVGMDVVKSKVEAVGGVLEINSVISKGTHIAMRLPLSISIIKALLVVAGRETFALPVSKVVRVFDIWRKDISTEENHPSFIYGDEEISLVNLKTALRIPSNHTPSAPKDPVSLAIVEAGDKRIGVVVDDFEGEVDTYIKPLPPPINKVKGISGYTTLGDGRPVFLLDVAGLLEIQTLI